MRNIISTSCNRYLHVISSVHLSRFKDGLIFELGLVINSLLNLGNVDFRYPRVSINYSKEDIVWINSMFFEFLFFKVLGTPRNIGCFSFLFILSNSMMAVTHHFEVFVVFGNQQLCFLY